MRQSKYVVIPIESVTQLVPVYMGSYNDSRVSESGSIQGSSQSQHVIHVYI